MALVLLIVLIISIFVHDHKETKYKDEIYNLKLQLNNIDTTKKYIVGIPDTVKIVKTVTVTKTVPIYIDMDTTVVLDEYHTMDIHIDVDSLMLGLECNRPELTITKVDTIKIREIQWIEKIQPKTGVAWTEYFYGVGTGVIAALITILVLK